jgi:hypothetical protein
MPKVLVLRSRPTLQRTLLQPRLLTYFIDLPARHFLRKGWKRDTRSLVTSVARLKRVFEPISRTGRNLSRENAGWTRKRCGPRKDRLGDAKAWQLPLGALAATEELSRTNRRLSSKLLLNVGGVLWTDSKH